MSSTGNNLIPVLREQASIQPPPLNRAAVDQYGDFFEAMATLWSLAGKHDLTDQIDFTNFVLFGPQSAGKTTLTERILGFPVAIVKRGVGTTRPVILTTRRQPHETVKVKTSGAGLGEDFQEIEKESVMNWATEQMRATGMVGNPPVPRITKDPIYIEVSGPDLMDRRFVDLPGYQTNDEGTRAAILDLLTEEVVKPNTVVVCVEDADLDYVNSHLMKAIEENHVFGHQFPNLSGKDKAYQFVLALNKSDKWFNGHDVTEDEFALKVLSYCNRFGIMPICVGGSTDETIESRDNFQEVVNQYASATVREAGIYREFFNRSSFDAGTSSLLQRRFLGFDNFLGTVDAIVVNRDIRNVGRIARKLSNISDQVSSEIDELQHKLEYLGGIGDGPIQNIQDRINPFLATLFSKMREIATADSGRGGSQAAASAEMIETFGNTAFEEEMDFLFGRRSDPNVPPFEPDAFGSGYYSTVRKYRMDSADVLRVKEAAKQWTKQIYGTLQELGPEPEPGTDDAPARSRTHMSISYIDQKLLTGKVYERALAVWSSSVYRLLMPDEKDLTRLANIVGTDYEMKDPNKFDIKKAKRLAEVYIERLGPPVHFLCQKIEFLLLMMFDTAWRVMLEIDSHETIVEAVGGEAFRREVRDRFGEAVRESARVAFSRAFSDLRNEILKLFPYSSDHASVAGMQHAFPGNAAKMAEWQKSYKEDIGKVLKSKCQRCLSDIQLREGMSDVLVEGIMFGIGEIAKHGSIDPLLLPGIQLIVNHMELEKMTKEQLGDGMPEEVKDEWLLGVACSLYAHFLPRFIATIDGRMRGDLWVSVKDPTSLEKIKSQVAKSSVLSHFAARIETLEEDLKALQTKKHELQVARDLLDAVQLKFPESREDYRTPRPVLVSRAPRQARQSNEDASKGARTEGVVVPIEEEEEEDEEDKEDFLEDELVDKDDDDDEEEEVVTESKDFEEGVIEEEKKSVEEDDVVLAEKEPERSIETPSAFGERYRLEGALENFNGVYVWQTENLYVKDTDPKVFFVKEGTRWLICRREGTDVVNWYWCNEKSGGGEVPADNWRHANNGAKALKLRLKAV